MAEKRTVERNIPGMMNRGPGARFAQVEHAENNGASLRRILTYFAKEKLLVAAMLAVVLFGTLCGVYAPSVQSRAIDMIAGDNMDKLMLTVILMAVAYLLYSGSQLLQGLLSARLSQNIVRHMREELFGKLVDLPVRYMDTHSHGDVIVSKDSLTITGGSYNVNCASHALVSKDDVCIADGEFAIVSGKDGVHAENADDAAAGFVCIMNGSYHIAAEGDGISAASYVQIENGTFDITAGGGSANAEKKSSDSWGNFMGGGKHRGGFGMENMSSSTDSSDSVSMKGIKAGTVLTINGGSFTINSADDAVHSNQDAAINGGTFEIASGDDAFHAEETLTVAGGTIHVSESYEGLEGMHIAVSGGDVVLTASDDGLNGAGGTDASGTTGGRDGRFGRGGMKSSSSGSIAISGGSIHVTAYGDGIDANGTIDMTGGYVIVTGPTRGDTATLDYDTRATISGGTFIGTGASGMAQTFSENTQGVIAVSVGNRSAGTELLLTDSDGSEVIRYTPELDYSVVILSSPEIVSGDSYTLAVGADTAEVAAK